MNASNHIRNLIAVASLVASAGMLIAIAAPAPHGRSSAQPVSEVKVAPAPVVGVATGEFDNGVPVYRLPSVTVAVSRSEELGKMAKEDALASK
jgi:hypothetical protein